ncbi:hypothetical protein A3I58_01550 [Candidatus Peregrinibacteria bacterium RIFCSPLOWO2_02_FULL_39_10]|nr:MAG: hypothetical protein A3I58_01550 [Candidatus Peregrinibacteria bacterium RIFCSPLOWO2_02_FULL_39_10]
MRKLTFEEIKKLKPSIEEVKRKKRNPVYAMLDNVRSLYNVGSVFRTSDAVLLNKLFLCGITGTPPRKEISKTALGAEDIVPWEQNDSSTSVIKKLKKAGVQIAAVELTDKSVQYDKAKYHFPVCFVFGHEVDGISDEVVNMADICVSVPMLGRANSLNVASCFAVIMYDALRKILK